MSALAMPGATIMSPAATAHAALRAASLLDMHVVHRIETGAEARCAGTTKPLTLLAAAQHASSAAGRLILSQSANSTQIKGLAELKDAPKPVCSIHTHFTAFAKLAAYTQLF